MPPFAHGLGATGCVKEATYGTGTSVMAPVDSVAFHVRQSRHHGGLWHDGEKLVYALAREHSHTGDAVAWIMADSTGLSERSPAELAQALECSCLVR